MKTPAQRQALAARIEADLPVTDAHRRAAFEAMCWKDWTYEQALRFPMRARLIEARAHQLRTREWQAQHQQATTVVHRTHPTTGQWRTQRVAGDWLPDQPNLPL